ncbi:hypothetical protein F2Q69_00061588 [Brassica cretica]|uniref:EF-hand domain-containing protein n=1 Tax=Brassica cretica TaxID=69181 RepID=A0A8S9RTV6_BRACR|nr:hypothetical protein F2Q69_00061588 [Brassica cretica]
MADAFTDEQIQEFYEAFCVLSHRQTLRCHPISDFFHLSRLNPVQTIMVQNTSLESASGELLEVFRVFDRDGDTLISALEKAFKFMYPTNNIKRMGELMQLGEGMKDMGMKITEEEAERMVREADLDGDGFLSYMSFPK